MVKVLVRGSLEDDREYTTLCGKCKSVLSYKYSDLSCAMDRNETVYHFVCPVCSSKVWVSSQALR